MNDHHSSLCKKKFTSNVSSAHYAPNFGKVEGEGGYCFELVCPFFHPSAHAFVQNLIRYSYEISYMDSSSKIIDTYFFKSGFSPFVELSRLKGYNDIL